MGFAGCRRCPWPAPLLAVAIVLQASGILADESFFADKLYPAMQAVQCARCHNDNGVASETQLSFPREGASREQVIAFGLKLMDLVDRDEPLESLIFLKPTNREEHTGGARFKPGSDEEKLLREWVEYLAGLSEAEIRLARERIARVEKLAATPLSVRRLTHSQYNNTIRDLLGDESQPASGFPKEDFVNGFTNQLEGQGFSPLQAEAYGKAAERLAVRAFRGGDHRGLVPGEPMSPADTELSGRFVRDFGLKAFRRPLTDAETKLYVRLLLDEANRSGAFLDGARLVVEAMLQSPHFLFRIERGPGGTFESYETASRLSYFLWDTMPDARLMAAAERGELSTVEQVETWARRLLGDPRAVRTMDQFLEQWMRFDRVTGATRDRRRFSEFGPELAAAMVEETSRLFHHLVWGDRNFMEFFSADYTFVNGDLARLYGLPAPGEAFERVAYPADSGRSGVLGHGSFLVATSNPSETSPTARGLFVRNQFLGHEVPSPPRESIRRFPNCRSTSR